MEKKQKITENIKKICQDEKEIKKDSITISSHKAEISLKKMEQKMEVWNFQNNLMMIIFMKNLKI